MKALAHHLRLVCTDLDGTLISSDLQEPADTIFFERLAEWRRNGPVVWLVNSGRDWSSLDEILRQKQFPMWPDWVVALEREIWLVRDKGAIGWYEWNRKCELLHQQLFASVKPVWAKVEAYVKGETSANIVADPGSPLGIIASSEDEADRIAAFISPLLEQWPNLVAVRNSIYFRFSHAYYNKGTCLQAIAHGLGIRPFEILVAGDHHNDLSMLQKRYASHIVCPGNAVAEIKKIVTAQGGHVSEASFMRGVVEGWDALLQLD
jgi:hypothetical protein